MVIVLAKEKDAKGILKLYRFLFEDMADLEPYFFENANQDECFIKTIISEKNSDIIVAKEENEILGFAVVQMQNTPPYNLFKKHRFAYLMDLVIEPEKRGKGIESRILEECENWAKDKGASYLELNVLNKNEKAYNLYLDKGFNEKMTSMYKKI